MKVPETPGTEDVGAWLRRMGGKTRMTKPVAQALENVRICDFTGQLAGAGATKILAAFGAEVIRIEDPFTEASGIFCGEFHHGSEMLEGLEAGVRSTITMRAS